MNIFKLNFGNKKVREINNPRELGDTLGEKEKNINYQNVIYSLIEKVRSNLDENKKHEIWEKVNALVEQPKNPNQELLDKYKKQMIVQIKNVLKQEEESEIAA